MLESNALIFMCFQSLLFWGFVIYVCDRFVLCRVAPEQTLDLSFQTTTVKQPSITSGAEPVNQFERSSSRDAPEQTELPFTDSAPEQTELPFTDSAPEQTDLVEVVPEYLLETDPYSLSSSSWSNGAARRGI